MGELQTHMYRPPPRYQPPLLRPPFGITPKITLTLIINKDNHKLLFALARKDFVDFLFNVLSLPIGGFVGLTQDRVDHPLVAEGSLLNLYNTIESLDENYCINPTLRKPYLFPTMLLTPCNNNQVGQQFAYPNIQLQCQMIAHDNNRNIATGFVQGETTYTIMDDLSVKATSLKDSVSKLIGLSGGPLDDVSNLEEREVVVGEDEAAKLLKELMITKNVLTAVFLG